MQWNIPFETIRRRAIYSTIYLCVFIPKSKTNNISSLSLRLYCSLTLSQAQIHTQYRTTRRWNTVGAEVRNPYWVRRVACVKVKHCSAVGHLHAQFIHSPAHTSAHFPLSSIFITLTVLARMEIVFGQWASVPAQRRKWKRNFVGDCCNGNNNTTSTRTTRQSFLHRISILSEHLQAQTVGYCNSIAYRIKSVYVWLCHTSHTQRHSTRVHIFVRVHIQSFLVCSPTSFIINRNHLEIYQS